MRDLLAYVAFRVATSLFAVLPESWVRSMGEYVGTLAARRKAGRYPLLTSHMSRVLGEAASADDVARAVRGMYRSYGRYWAETFWFRPRRRDAIVDNVDRIHFDPIFASMQAGRGRIFALPHIGNWEVAGLIAADIGSPVVAVAEHLPNQRITDWFLDVRKRFGIEIILTSDPNRTRKLITVLKQGRAVALVADRDVTGRGVEVEFFGEKTTMPGGAVSLAELTGADLIPVGVYFKEGRGHRIEVRDAVRLPDLPSREQRVAAGVQEFARVLEDIIRVAPSQWHLFQPNWPSDEQRAGTTT